METGPMPFARADQRRLLFLASALICVAAFRILVGSPRVMLAAMLGGYSAENSSGQRQEEFYTRPEDRHDYTEVERGSVPGVFGLGHLPGDIATEVGGMHVYAPLMSSLLLSVLLSWLVRVAQQQAA